MKIIIDNKIPCIKGALEPYAEVVYLYSWQRNKRGQVSVSGSMDVPLALVEGRVPDYLSKCQPIPALDSDPIVSA